MTADVKTAGFNDKMPAWWGLGIEPDNAYGWSSVSEAMEATGMNYNLHLGPCITTFNDKQYNFADRRVVVREPSLGDTEPVMLDVVSDIFELVQNMEIAERFDNLCNYYKLATLGVLGKGQKIWVAFKTDSFDIAGDPFDGYLVIYGNQAGGGSYHAYYTDVRIVCANTLQRSLDNSLDMMSFAHKGNVKGLLEMRGWAETEVASKRLDVITQWEALVKTKVDAMQTATIIEAAFPDAKKGKALRMGESAPDILQRSLAQELFKEAKIKFDKSLVTVDANRLGVAQNLIAFNDKHPQFAGTAYAVVNAVTEYADWPANPRSDTAQATMFGYRNVWKQKAWKAAMKIAFPKQSDN